MQHTDDVILKQLVLLTAQELPASPPAAVKTDPETAFGAGGISYSQLNELLLSFRYDRVSKGFFNYFFLTTEDRERLSRENFQVDYNSETPLRISSLDGFVKGVEWFRKIAMLEFGNIKYGFKYFRDKHFDAISRKLGKYKPLIDRDFTERPAPIVECELIERENTYLLGTITGEKVKALKVKEASGNSLSAEDKGLCDLREQVVQKAIKNYGIYLCSDYMDVYVATSMRRREDFYEVYDFVQKVFNDPDISGLNVRYFDPTQADPQDRIDKSLLEGLMIKRAKCTVYCAQESDTFGKDSELAATMAQGKPVVAYVPRVDDVAKHAGRVRMIADECGGGNVVDYLKDMFVHRHSRYVLDNKDVFREGITEEDLALRLAQEDKKLYEKRARVLKELHPLSLQVNINTGVANGLLIVRDEPTCAKVLHKILLRTLEFTIEPWELEGGGTSGFVLRETETNSIFRVVTGDQLLTNSFWNFYPEETE